MGVLDTLDQWLDEVVDMFLGNTDDSSAALRKARVALIAQGDAAPALLVATSAENPKGQSRQSRNPRKRSRGRRWGLRAKRT